MRRTPHDDGHDRRVGGDQYGKTEPVHDRSADERSEETSQRIRAVDDPEGERDASGRGALGERREDQAGVPEAERLNAAREGENPHVRREDGQCQRGERGNERADDQRLASVPVGERSPERQERQTDDARKRGDRADPERDGAQLDAKLRQVERRERGDLAIGRDLEESGDGEEDRHADPAGNRPHFHGVSKDTRRV